MWRIACLFLLAACCTVRPKSDVRQECVSSCGILFVGAPNGAMSCEQLQDAEDVTLKIMDEDHCKDDPRMCRAAACAELFGYQIVTEDADAIAWIVDGEILGPFAGVTNAATKTITLANAYDWRHGSFPHEVVHAMQGMIPPKGWKESKNDKGHGHGHVGWTEHGIYDSVAQIRKGRN